jgi:hypothetical protein
MLQARYAEELPHIVMDMSKLDLVVKEKLFQLYADNLSVHFPKLRDVFLCPICLNAFLRDALYTVVDVRDALLTAEHIIPEAIGGQICTLTCKECNNRIGGSQLDSHLIQKLKVDDLDLNETPLRVWAQVKGYGVEVELYVNDQHLEIYSLSNAPGPNSRIVELIDIVQTVEQETGRINIDPGIAGSRGLLGENDQLSFALKGRSGYSPLRLKCAILKIGYLLMFHFFGYEYILHKNLQQVRTQILNPDNDSIISQAVFPLEQASPNPNGVNLLYLPKSKRCFFVTLAIFNRFFGVVLPGLDDASESIYEKWNVSGKVDFKIIPIPPDPEFRKYGFPTWIWYNADKEMLA